MFEIKSDRKGNKVLVYNREARRQRGYWVEVCHENDKEAQYYVETNRNNGLRVEKDERGYWRALVCSE